MDINIEIRNGIGEASIVAAELEFEAVFPDSSYTVDSTQKANYTSTQRSTLETIAAACPQEYGPGVYVARAMLSAQDTVIYTAINDCEKAPVTPSARFAAPEQDEEEDSINSFNLYPNPNSGLFTVDIGLGDEEQAELHVWNISGQLVAQQGLSNGQSSIGLDVSNGLYLYVVTVNGERRWTGKVSVTSE
ncbi:MAG: hypothetical protein ACJATE_001369 [Bacteroidia bacterium]